jgi:hypothetical protein
MLVGICGTLGSGKTLSLTFFGHYFRTLGYSIFANYKLTFPHTRINSLKAISSFRNGVFLADELWSWVDSREFGSKKNKEINAILLKSRKRGIDIFYTSQHFKQMDVRIRRITDVVVFPMMLKNQSRCRLYFFDNAGFKVKNPITYKTKPIMKLYDTEEEVEDIEGFEGQKAVQAERERRALERQESREEKDNSPDRIVLTKRQVENLLKNR